MDTPMRVRMDKWLWAVRLFKTRSQATAACDAGHVKIAGQSVKPSRDVHAGEVITVFTGLLHRTVRPTVLLDHRVAGKLVPQHMDDLTPPEEIERARIEAQQQGEGVARTLGRPTKKQRRIWEAAFPEGSA